MALIPRFSKYPLDKELITGGDPEKLFKYMQKLVLELTRAYDAFYTASREIGSHRSQVREVNSSCTLEGDDSVILVDASSGAVTLTLRTANNLHRKVYTVVKTDSSANAVTLDPTGSETINGAATKSLTSQWDKVSIVSDKSNWIEV